MSDFDDFLAALRRRLADHLAGGGERLGDLCYETGLSMREVLEFRDGGSYDRALVERLAAYLWPEDAA